MIKPILKWAGGKRQLLPEIRKYIPETFNTYFEPFIGGGAVLFDLKPETAVINDINDELINLYNTIKISPDDLIKELKTYKNEQDFYTEIRNLDRSEDYKDLSNIKKAARMIYLNRTCFNGLWRVNKKGQNNVPFGRYTNPLICDEETINDLSKFFNDKNIQILNESYTEVLKLTEYMDFVYLDPPYDKISDTSFTSYSSFDFDRKQQKKLKEECDKLTDNNVFFLQSNADTPFIRELYKDYEIIIIKANRNINSDASKRNKINEVLIRNY